MHIHLQHTRSYSNIVYWAFELSKLTFKEHNLFDELLKNRLFNKMHNR